MEPYVIKQGDYVDLLAHQFGFDADTVWNDDKNTDLRQLRPDPNILHPGDVLYIPDQVSKPPAMTSLSTGTTNAFVSDPPLVPVTLKFLDPDFASQAYTVQELPLLTGKTTGADGTMTLSIPVTLATFTVVFTESGTTVGFRTGHLDPIDTLSGVFQRLQNLGYIGSDASAIPSPDINLVRTALQVFKAQQAGGAPAPADPSPASGASSDAVAPSDPAPAPDSAPAEASSESAPAPSGPPSTPASSGASSSSSSEGEDSPPPSSGPVSAPIDNSGLDDNGKLDAATSKLLLAAHLS